MLSRYIWLVATVSDNTDHFHVAESSIGLHCSKAFEFCPGIVLCREVDEWMLPELASPSSPLRVVKWDMVLKLVLKFLTVLHIKCWELIGFSLSLLPAVLESWLDYTGELEPPQPLARLPQLKHCIKQLLTDLGKVQQISLCCSTWNRAPKTNGGTIQGRLQEELCIF